jgi:hypothetical protein
MTWQEERFYMAEAEEKEKQADPTPLATQDQVQPKGTGVDVCRLVQKDLELRIELGKARYGERLTTFNGRDALLDAYQEVLDLAVYLRQEIEERQVKHERVVEKIRGLNLATSNLLVPPEDR